MFYCMFYFTCGRSLTRTILWAVAVAKMPVEHPIQAKFCGTGWLWISAGCRLLLLGGWIGGNLHRNLLLGRRLLLLLLQQLRQLLLLRRL